jgi:hypothetical protein
VRHGLQVGAGWFVVMGSCCPMMSVFSSKDRRDSERKKRFSRNSGITLCTVVDVFVKHFRFYHMHLYITSYFIILFL